MKNYLIQFLTACIIIVCFVVLLCPCQSIEIVKQENSNQISITESAKKASILQWTFDDRPDAIWNRISDIRRPRDRKVTFLAPYHQNLIPKYRVIKAKQDDTGEILFNANRIHVLNIRIKSSDIEKMLANLPTSSNGDGQDGVGGLEGGIGNNVDNQAVDPGDPGDFPGGPVAAEFKHAYVSAMASFDGRRSARIGIRIKGNASLMFAVNENRKNYPFKIDLNYFKTGQNIDGIKKLNLHPVVSKKPQVMADGSIAAFPGNFGLEEYLSYGAFRSFGVPSSRTGWMDVYMNDEYLGLYTIVENLDVAFMERNYGKVPGSIYKPEGEYLEWIGDDYSMYPFLNWKGGSNQDHNSIIHFIDVINHSSLESYPQVLDIQSVFNYTAGNVALGNWDTYEALGHNYLLCEGAPGRFQMLPWDMNLSQSENPGSSIYGRVESSGETDTMDMPTPALTNRIFDLPSNDARYRNTLQAFIDGPASEKVLNARIDDAVTLLGSRLDKDAIDFLRSNIKIRLKTIHDMLE